MTNKHEIQIEGRLTAVETNLEEIVTNHLPHLEAKMDKVIWLIITSLLGLVGILLKLLIK